MATMTYEEFRKKHPATRCFQRYDHDTRAMHAASHRLGRLQRQRVGEYFYTHPMVPGVAFGTAKQATTRAYRMYSEAESVREVCEWLETA